ncbi:MAG: hypothetical protein E7324_01140 [Clostridiales bacterium]|nr:hypothetical protein [Clostridiales bacterium]
MLIRQAAFENNKKMLKGNLHCHTTRSDGQADPATDIRHYAAAGYDFLSLTDHRYYNYENYAPETGLLIIPGTELDALIPDAGIHCVHVVSVGPEKQDGNGFDQDQRFDTLRIEEAAQAQPLIDTILENNNLPIFCHPEWSGNTCEEVKALSDFSLMEIWNSGCAIENGLDTNAAYWDELLCAGRKIYGVATDDSHGVPSNCHGYIRVNAEKNVSSILDALKRGAFYASCGPEIYDFYVEDGRATVICSPASAIRFRHFRVPYHCHRGSHLTALQTNVRPGTRYIRAEVEDAQGRKAWTNPIFLD